jgi:hypothetical protein
MLDARLLRQHLPVPSVHSLQLWLWPPCVWVSSGHCRRRHHPRCRVEHQGVSACSALSC